MPNSELTAVRILLTQRAREHVRYGFDLARRRSLHSARAEFTRALECVARGLDKQEQTDVHGWALAAALQAFEESDDFLRGDLLVTANVDVAAVASAHKTDVLHDTDLSRMTPFGAMRRYYQYAKEQVVLASGNDPVASTALHGWARTEMSLSLEKRGALSDGGPKAIALYQAAVLTDPRNYRAANELGVMLARFGQMRQALPALSHSLSVHAAPTTWDNLAVVYEKLGDVQRAQHARGQSESLTASADDETLESGSDNPDRLVRWVDSATFAGSFGPAPQVSIDPQARPAVVESSPDADTQRSPLSRVFSFLQPSARKATDQNLR
jgi:tetratricopeptide (TPR) repeat protein